MEKKEEPCQCGCHKNNPNKPHHHNNLSKKHFHIKKNFFTKMYFLIFFISFGLIMFIVIINAIFMGLNIKLPRIFFPGFLLYIATIVCSGGILGSYGPVPTSEAQLLQMRKCTSVIMLIMCLICSPIFLYQNIFLYSSVKDSKLYCEENDGKSKGNAINKLINEKQHIFSLKNNYEYKYKNHLTCLESRKCLKSISDSKIFICNYNAEEILNIGKCTKVFELDKIGTSLDSGLIPNFVSSCMDLKKTIRPNIEIYRCLSEQYLPKEDSITPEEQESIEQNYKNKMENFNQKISDISQKLDYNDDDSIYYYDEECHSNIAYFFYLMIIVIHILLHLFVSFVWIGLAINTIMKFFGLMEDDELNYYQEKMKQMNKIYEESQQKKNKIENIQNEIDENTPINIK